MTGPDAMLGMRGPAPRDWAALTPEDARAALAHWPGLGGVRRIRWHSPRPFSAAAIVETEGGAVFVKRHGARVRSAAGLAEEHRFMAHLAARGQPVAHVRATASGPTALTLGGWTYEVHNLAPGRDLYRDTPSWTPFAAPGEARAAGRAIAGLHCAAEGHAAPARAPAVLQSRFEMFATPDPIAALAGAMAARPMLAAALAVRPWAQDIARVHAPFHAAFLPHLAALAPLWTHNDLHASNLLWDEAGERVEAVLDFGLSDRGSAVYDLATAIERNAIAWNDLDGGGVEEIGRPEIAAALVEGYRAVRPLSPAEAAALPAILPLVHADFALSELEYFHGILGSAADAELAYASFFVGHAAWFGREAGRAFLAALRSALA